MISRLRKLIVVVFRVYKEVASLSQRVRNHTIDAVRVNKDVASWSKD